MNFAIPQSVNSSLIWVTMGAISALAAGTVVRIRALRGAAEGEAKKRMDSLRSWWVITLSVCAAVMLGRAGVCTLMAVVSLLALRELLQLIELRQSDRASVGCAVCVLFAHYGLIYTRQRELAHSVLPLAMILFVGAVSMFSGKPQGFVKSVSLLCWGVMLTTFALSHAAMLTTIDRATSAVGVVGLFLFAVVTTEINDISQALVGRRIGKRKITPALSPHKTWEGFLGGIAATAIVAGILGRWLLPSDVGWTTSALWGLIIAIAGFLGDIHMSAMKRDIGVKDSGALFPGQGGILDRIDSLTFSAPVFFYVATLAFDR